MRKNQPKYLSLINFFVFCLFMVALWSFSFDISPVSGLGIGRTELEIILLQSVSFLLMTTAYQMTTRAAEGWRPVLLTLAFVALSESSLVAFLSPVS